MKQMLGWESIINKFIKYKKLWGFEIPQNGVIWRIDLQEGKVIDTFKIQGYGRNYGVLCKRNLGEYKNFFYCIKGEIRKGTNEILFQSIEIKKKQRKGGRKW